MLTALVISKRINKGKFQGVIVENFQLFSNAKVAMELLTNEVSAVYAGKTGYDLAKSYVLVNVVFPQNYPPEARWN